jgi:hypothetical protein
MVFHHQSILLLQTPRLSLLDKSNKKYLGVEVPAYKVSLSMYGVA